MCIKKSEKLWYNRFRNFHRSPTINFGIIRKKSKYKNGMMARINWRIFRKNGIQTWNTNVVADALSRQYLNNPSGTEEEADDESSIGT